MILVSVYVFILGTGIGLVMQITIIAAQNSVPYRDMGTATGGINFFRSIGGALGVALFGSVLSDRLAYYIPRLVPSEALQNISARALTASPAQIRALPEAVHEGVINAFANSVHVVFLVAIPIALAGFVLALLLPEIPLRDTIHGGGQPDAAPSPPTTEPL
jgi:hypothetical protein